MLKDDFYADPTVFDHWHDHTSSWFEQQLEKLRPYVWSMGFTALAGGCLLIALGVLASLLISSWNGAELSGWNRMLAQSLTLFLSSVATYRLLKLSISAWPPGRVLSWPLRPLAGCFGWRPEAGFTMGAAHASSPDRPGAKPTHNDTKALREFFSGVRKAGVNVTIAKALFAAGVRSAQQVCSARNQDLLKIPGVGPATVRKLRTQFGAA